MIDLRFIRDAVGLSQGKLAETVGISRQSLIGIESGESVPRLDTARRIVDAIKTAYMDLPPPIPNKHLNAMVLDFLQNPFGFSSFDPNDGGGTGRKGLSKKTFNNPPERQESKNEQIETAARGAASIATDAAGAHPVTAIKAAVSIQDFPVPPKPIVCFEDALDRYRQISSIRPVNQKELGALYVFVSQQPWAARNGEPRSVAAVQKWLSRNAGVSLRERSKDTGAQRRNEALLQLLSGPIAQRRKDSHNKGAGDYALGSLTAIVKGVLRDPATLEALNQHPDIRGELPTVSNIIRLVSQHRGGVDGRNEVRDHLEKTIGFRAAWAGQVAIVDATGWPVRFRFGDTRENHKRWLYLMCDVASARLHIANRSATSESEGWMPQDNPERNDVMIGFLRDLGFAPEWLVNDAISTLTAGLRNLKPGTHPAEKLSAGTLLWLAAGVRPYVRMGERPTGGSHVERAVRTTKDKLAELGTKRAVEKESKGCGLQRLNYCDNELEFLEQLSKAVSEINTGPLKRRGCPFSRNDLNALDSAARNQEARKLATNLFRANEDGFSLWWQIVSDCKVGQIASGRVAVRINGKAWTAELQEPESGWECRPEEKFALILPPGARHNDDPESFRVLVIEADGSRVQYHPATARTLQVDEYYQDMSKPLIGSFRAKPQTTADQFAALNDKDAASYRKRLKDGTTGETINDQSDPESRFR